MRVKARMICSVILLFVAAGIGGHAAASDKEVKVGGRIMNDWTGIEGDDALRDKFGDLLDGTEFRRARIFVSGTMYENVEFKAQFDFAGDPDFKDVYIGLKNVPYLGKIRTGHFKEPFSLEELTSSKYTTFMERALPNAFSPSRNTGIAVFNDYAEERVTCGIGVFRETDEFGKDVGEGEYCYTARVTGLPLDDVEHDRLIHLGASFSLRNPQDGMVHYSQRPSVHLAPKFVDTKTIDSVNHVYLTALEMAGVIGPVPFQAEYIRSALDADAVGDPEFSGYYVEVGVFLTGEHRNYKKSEAAFDRTKPKSNFFAGTEGRGALELAARFAAIDLDDQDIAGGRMEDLTLGLNWHLNPYTRLMVNYVHAVLKGVGNADAVMSRFQIDF